jgi:serine/threonine protein kinase
MKQAGCCRFEYQHAQAAAVACGLLPAHSRGVGQQLTFSCAHARTPGALPVATLQVITPLLRILEKMHSMMLLHRDIKPENIFLTGMGKFKIGDFGLAIRFDKELAFSRSGTLDYMSPEVSGSLAGAVLGCADRPADAWAVCSKHSALPSDITARPFASAPDPA